MNKTVMTFVSTLVVFLAGLFLAIARAQGWVDMPDDTVALMLLIGGALGMGVSLPQVPKAGK